MPKNGFGNKARRTKKCSCDNPQWTIWEVRVTVNYEVIISLDCGSCKSLWDSKSRESRKYVDLSKPAFGGRSKSVTYEEFFRKADDDRKQMLFSQIIRHENEIKELEKAIIKTKKEIELLD